MRLVKNNVERFKFVAIFFACMISIGFGLSDYDYFWQCLLGKYYLQGKGFYASRLISWGSLGKEPYLDHEWLSNIILYLFSTLGDYGAFLAKLVLCTLVGISILIFINRFKDSIVGYKFYIVVLDICLIAGLLFKIKPYMFSIAFFMLEILMLYDYEKTKDLKIGIMQSCMLVLLWNNMHSGSIPLYFAMAGIFWLTHLREKKSVLIGVSNLVVACINPYGYKLILFDFLHNSEKIMKLYNKDWQPLDTKNIQSVLLSIVVLSTIYICLTHNLKKDLFAVLGFVSVLFLSMGSSRHLMYILPFVIILLSNIESVQDDNFYAVGIVSLVVTVFFVLNSANALTREDFRSDYLAVHIDDELASILIETVKEPEGLFVDADMNEVIYYGITPFYSGAYPESPSRCNDAYFLNNFASPQHIEEIIDYYDLNKFLVTKPSVYEGYLVTGSLYDYLSENDKYEMLYDNNFCAYFVEKDLVD